MTDQQKQDIQILYDGSCPFCTRYVRLLRLRQNLSVHLVDARQDSTLKQEATRNKFDLDRGMIVKFNGQFYYGDRAMNMLALLSTPSNIFNRIMIGAFGSKLFMRTVYPVFSFIRLCTVLLLGRGRINNLK